MVVVVAVANPVASHRVSYQRLCQQVAAFCFRSIRMSMLRLHGSSDDPQAMALLGPALDLLGGHGASGHIRANLPFPSEVLRLHQASRLSEARAQEGAVDSHDGA